MGAAHSRAVPEPGGDFFGSHVLSSGVDRELLERLSEMVVTAQSAPDRYTVRAPFTLEPVGTLPLCTSEDVSEAVQRARGAQPEWAEVSFRERRRILLRFHDLLLDRREQALDLIQLESGKARRYALEEVLDTALVARHYAVHAGRYLRTRKHRGAVPIFTDAWEYRQPVGVVGFIAPWNFPLILSITDLIAALMAGNGAVLRPDLQSSFTALWAVSLLCEAGVPRNLVQVITGEGQALGPALIGAVDFIMFTGSTETGRIVARQAAELLIGCSLELGGKNSMLVLECADVDSTAEALVRGAFAGAGQVCVSMERAWIPVRMFSEFSEKFLSRVRSMKLSPEMHYGVDMGSLTVPAQLSRVQDHVRDALGKGAVLLAGGRARPDLGPLFYEPTVLTGVTPEMTIYAEETFGPVVSLFPYTSLDEAVDRINDTQYGLNASVWSKDAAAAVRVARRIHAGTVNVNECYAATWTATAAPIGGMKQSGLGRRHGAEGILKYTEAQTIAVQRGFPLSPPPSISEEKFANMLARLLRIVRRIPGLR